MAFGSVQASLAAKVACDLPSFLTDSFRQLPPVNQRRIILFLPPKCLFFLSLVELSKDQDEMQPIWFSGLRKNCPFKVFGSVISSAEPLPNLIAYFVAC